MKSIVFPNHLRLPYLSESRKVTDLDEIMNRKTAAGHGSAMADRRGVVASSRGRVESDNDDMDESGLSDDDDEQVY